MKPSPAQLRARKKFARMAKARSKASKAAKRAKKKKNPYRFVASKGRRKVKTGSFASRKELKGLTKKSYAFEQALGRGYLRKRSKKGRAVARATKAVKRVLKAAPSARKKAIAKAASLRKKGYKIKKVYISPKSALASAMSAGKRKRRKRRGGKRKTSRKESKVAKRRRKKKSGGKRKASRKRKHARKSPRRRRARRARRSKGRVIVLRRKNQGVTIRRKNPALLAQIEQYSGFKAEELGSLLIGGALYGTVDGALAKYLPTVYAQAAKIPVIGTTILPALAGGVLQYLGQKQKIKALSMVGEGLVGAAVVAMGIQASHFLPGIGAGAAAPVAGVDFTPGRGVMMGGYARDGADFGNVDFTPGPGVMMGNQPQLGMQAQLGSAASSRNGADFGMLVQGLDGMGEVPAGLA